MSRTILKSKKRVSKALKKSSKKMNALMRRKRMVGGCSINLGIEIQKETKESTVYKLGRSELLDTITGFDDTTKQMLTTFLPMVKGPYNSNRIILTKHKNGKSKEISYLRNTGSIGLPPDGVSKIEPTIEELETIIKTQDPTCKYTLNIFDFRDGDCTNKEKGMNNNNASANPTATASYHNNNASANPTAAASYPGVNTPTQSPFRRARHVGRRPFERIPSYKQQTTF